MKKNGCALASLWRSDFAHRPKLLHFAPKRSCLFGHCSGTTKEYTIGSIAGRECERFRLPSKVSLPEQTVAALFTLLVLGVLAGPLQAQMTGFAAAEAISRENRARADSIAESVDTGTGAFIFESSVMSVLGRRDVIVDLAFNSLLTAANSPLGPGWSHPFLAHLEGDPNGVVTVYWDPNQKNSFQFTRQGLPYERAAIVQYFGFSRGHARSPMTPKTA
jgi:hypothetical protein